MIRGDLTILREKKVGRRAHRLRLARRRGASRLWDATTPMRMSYSSFLRLFEDELRYPVPWSKRFAVETFDEKLIGNCMYYDIDNSKGQAELGIMIGDRDYWNQGYGTDVVNTLVSHVFSTTSLKRIYLHTLTWNLRAQKSFQKCGFVPLREVKRSGYEFLLMELTRDRWETLAAERAGQAEGLACRGFDKTAKEWHNYI